MLYTNGLAVTEIDGSYFLCDAAGEIKATIGDIIIFTADERNNTFGELTVQTIKENQIYGLTIHVDEEYMLDEATAYPVRINPTIEITSASGTGAIEDVTLNSAAVSAGSSGSLYIGNRQNYGITRILMKFPGLSFTNIVSADNISSATVEIRDIMCEAASMNISVHPFTGNTWTEATADWTNVSPNSYGAAVDTETVSYSIGSTKSHRYAFNILSIVKGWKNGTYSQGKGILFKSPSSLEGTTTYQQKTFASFNRTSYQPSLSVTYSNGIIVSQSSATISVGSTLQLNCQASGSYRWISGNERIATVSSNGLVTAKACGQVVVGAFLDSDSNMWDYCTVTVTPNTSITTGITNGGAYIIKNANDSTKCLTATSSGALTIDTYVSGNNNQLWYVKKPVLITLLKI